MARLPLSTGVTMASETRLAGLFTLQHFDKASIRLIWHIMIIKFCITGRNPLHHDLFSSYILRISAG